MRLSSSVFVRVPSRSSLERIQSFRSSGRDSWRLVLRCVVVVLSLRHGLLRRAGGGERTAISSRLVLGPREEDEEGAADEQSDRGEPADHAAHAYLPPEAE